MVTHSFLQLFRLCRIVSIYGFSLIFTQFFVLPVYALEITHQLENKIKSFFPNAEHLSLKPFDNQLIEISAGSHTYFASGDGRYLFAGPVLDTSSGQNITELKERQYRQKRISSLNDAMTLSFPASTPSRSSVTLFTDIDCGYCRRFHAQIEKYTRQGIDVNYVMLPRAGRNSSSFVKTVSVLCSDNPRKNMTLAMKNQFTGTYNCSHSLVQQMQLAEELGIDSTPTMVLPGGEKAIGLIPPTNLLVKLNLKEI